MQEERIKTKENEAARSPLSKPLSQGKREEIDSQKRKRKPLKDKYHRASRRQAETNNCYIDNSLRQLNIRAKIPVICANKKFCDLKNSFSRKARKLSMSMISNIRKRGCIKAERA